MEALDLWRSLNALLALASAVLIGGWIRHRWSTLSIEIKFAGMGLVLLNIAVFYGSLEAAYWPHLYLRIPLATVAMIWIVFAGGTAFLNRNNDG